MRIFCGTAVAMLTAIFLTVFSSKRPGCITGALKGTHRESLLTETAWTTLKDRRSNHKLSMMYKIVMNLAPPYLTESDNLVVLYARIERFKKTFLISSAC